MRNLFIFPEYENEIVLKIITLCPEKWLLIDRETGQMYQGSPKGHWDKLKPIIKVDRTDE